MNLAVLEQFTTSPWFVALLGILGGVLCSYLTLRFRYAAKLAESREGLERELLIARERIGERERDIEGVKIEIEELERELFELREGEKRLLQSNTELTTRIQEERKLAQEKLVFLEDTKRRLEESFKSLSQDVFQQNREQFLDLAKLSFEKHHESAKGELDQKRVAIDELVKPIKESLEKVDGKLVELEKHRTGDFASLKKEIELLATSGSDLRRQAETLSRALRNPQVRGRWGEMQLRRVVELAGMQSYCDFIEQESTNTENGRLRPDMVVKLPNNKTIIIDSKVALSAYLEALESTDDDVRQFKFKEHARQVRDKVTQLARKSYWEEFGESADFAVLFLPGELFLGAALEQDPDLVDFSGQHRIVIATPMTLIALLRAVAYGWRQEQVAQNAQQISELGRTLYKRMQTFMGHLEGLGKGLDKAIGSFNSAVGSLESSVLPAARKFKELGSSSNEEELEGIAPIEKRVRSVEVEVLKLSE